VLTEPPESLRALDRAIRQLPDPSQEPGDDPKPDQSRGGIDGQRSVAEPPLGFSACAGAVSVQEMVQDRMLSVSGLTDPPVALLCEPMDRASCPATAEPVCRRAGHFDGRLGGIDRCLGSTQPIDPRARLRAELSFDCGVAGDAYRKGVRRLALAGEDALIDTAVGHGQHERPGIRGQALDGSSQGGRATRQMAQDVRVNTRIGSGVGAMWAGRRCLLIQGLRQRNARRCSPDPSRGPQVVELVVAPRASLEEQATADLPGEQARGASLSGRGCESAGGTIEAQQPGLVDDLRGIGHRIGEIPLDESDERCVAPEPLEPRCPQVLDLAARGCDQRGVGGGGGSHSARDPPTTSGGGE
jgi:hypothetical protein